MTHNEVVRVLLYIEKIMCIQAGKQQTLILESLARVPSSTSGVNRQVQDIFYAENASDFCV
jgi:hypothetical protein